MVKTILITGATSGIGKAFVVHMSENKDVKLILLARDQEKLNSLKASNAIKICVDLLSVSELSKKISSILEEESVDVLINNAGVGVPTSLDGLDVLEKYDLMMDTNVKSMVQLTSIVLKQMKTRNSGLIINISSEAGLVSNPVAPLYCASKFAVEAFSDGLRQQLKQEEKDVRVTVIRPGPIATNYWGDREVPKEKFLTSKEVANIIKYVIFSPSTVAIKSIDLESARK